MQDLVIITDQDRGIKEGRLPFLFFKILWNGFHICGVLS